MVSALYYRSLPTQSRFLLKFRSFSTLNFSSDQTFFLLLPLHPPSTSHLLSLSIIFLCVPSLFLSSWASLPSCIASCRDISLIFISVPSLILPNFLPQFLFHPSLLALPNLPSSLTASFFPFPTFPHWLASPRSPLYLLPPSTFTILSRGT